MEYFRKLLGLLETEQEEDRASYRQLMEAMPVAERRANGMSWYPVAIRDTETGRGDYLTVELERTTHRDLIHQLRFGMPAALFSNHDPSANRIEGVITHQSGDRLKLSLRVDELPDWTRDGKLGVDAVFDENSYDEMRNALKQADALAEKPKEGRLVQVLTGATAPTFHTGLPETFLPVLNPSQQQAVHRILSANELAIVHGPPGTGKTTTLVQAIHALIRRDHERILVVAPSNAAVDLLSERLSEEGLNVVRVGNPVRVSERLQTLTLDSRMEQHAATKEIRRLKKQANEFRDMAHKYKRNFGRDEREQRKALFAEARSIGKEVERTEQYIIDDILAKAQVVTATLVGANHYTVRQLRYQTVVIDEAGQALEPACWIPVLKASKVILAGDHCQLPPTVKSALAAQGGLGETLLEKCVRLHPEAVTLLEEQYRMHDQIMNYPSSVFYGGRLQAHPSVARRLLFAADMPFLFIDTAGCGFEEKWEGTSLSNPEEAALLLRHLSLLVQQLQEEGVGASAAVISPYKHQVEILKEQLAQNAALKDNIRIHVNTIDSFQGQERDIVYISMVRSNTENNIGFLSDIRRMNVAMTRARKKLVIMGDSATLAQSKFYEELIAYAERQDAYLSAWSFM